MDRNAPGQDQINLLRVEPSTDVSSASLIQRIRQGNTVDLKWLQTANQATIRQRDTDGSTPLHALLEANKKLDQSSLTNGIQVLLAKGAEIGVKDGRGRTPLHIATMYRAPVEALSQLLSQNSSHVNALDDDSHTPLHLLLLGDDPVHYECLRVLLQSGANLEARNNVQTAVQPLYLLCERNDVSPLLAVVLDVSPDVVWRHKVPLLNYATAKGTSSALKALLEQSKEESREMKLMDHLLLEAAGSDCEPTEKSELLVSHGADLNRLPSLGGCTVFHVAANRGLPVLVQMALKRGMKPNVSDEDGNTPIHYAAESGTGGAECIRVLADSGADVNAPNNFGLTPVSSAVASENVEAVVELIKHGSCLPSTTIAREYGPKQLGILASIQVVESALDPLKTALKIGGFFKKCAQVDVGYNDQYNHWARSMETVAMEMLDCDESDGTNDLLNNSIVLTAVENKQKQFIAHGAVQNHLRRVWNGPQRLHGLEFLRYYFGFLFYHLAKIIVFPGLLLFYYLPRYRRHGRFYATRFLYSTPPSVRYGVDALCYMGFVITLFLESVLGSGQRSRSELDTVEIVVLIYTVGYALHETRQIARNTLRKYFSTWTNLIDIVVLLMFSTYFVIRFNDLSSQGLNSSKNKLDTHRAAALIFALATLIVCLRVLDYLKAFPGIGPIQASFRQITQDTVSFLIIMVVFGIAFATSISEVYSAGRFSNTYQNLLNDCANDYRDNQRNMMSNASGPPPTVSPDYGNNYFYDYVFACVDAAYTNGRAERSVPKAVDGVSASLVSLVWATFGMMSPDDFESQHQIETIVGKFLLGLWLLASVVVLVNMLIAIITTSFQSVQENADLEFKFVRASVISDMEMYPTVPPPLNIPYVIARFIAYIGVCACIKFGEIASQDEIELKCTSPVAAKMLLNYLNQEAEKQDNKSATKRDIKQLERQLDLIVQQIAQMEQGGHRVITQAREEPIPPVTPSLVRPRTAGGQQIDTFSAGSCEKMLSNMKMLFETTMARIDSRMQGMETRLNRVDSKLYKGVKTSL